MFILGLSCFYHDAAVCLLRSDYARWVDCAKSLTAGVSAAELQAFFYQNAVDAYGLTPASA